MTTRITESVPERSNEIQAQDTSERHPNPFMSAGDFHRVRAEAPESDPTRRSRTTGEGGRPKL